MINHQYFASKLRVKKKWNKIVSTVHLNVYANFCMGLPKIYNYALKLCFVICLKMHKCSSKFDVENKEMQVQEYPLNVFVDMDTF